MNIRAKQGHKVIVTPVTINYGYEMDKIHANAYLKVGEVYTVESIDIHDWSSGVTLKEIPDRVFNSVHFEDFKD